MHVWPHPNAWQWSPRFICCWIVLVASFCNSLVIVDNGFKHVICFQRFLWIWSWDVETMRSSCTRLPNDEALMKRKLPHVPIKINRPRWDKRFKGAMDVHASECVVASDDDVPLVSSCAVAPKQQTLRTSLVQQGLSNVPIPQIRQRHLLVSSYQSRKRRGHHQCCGNRGLGSINAKIDAQKQKNGNGWNWDMLRALRLCLELCALYCEMTKASIDDRTWLAFIFNCVHPLFRSKACGPCFSSTQTFCSQCCMCDLSDV